MQKTSFLRDSLLVCDQYKFRNDVPVIRPCIATMFFYQLLYFLLLFPFYRLSLTRLLICPTECECPFCDEVTGTCDCPANTVGPNCGVCRQGYCFFDPIRGCQSCQCDRIGVESNNLACDPTSCQCTCKPSHKGLRCNECAKGFHGYPLCWPCDCDPRGVTEAVCDVNYGKCICKVRCNVRQHYSLIL